jgi:hypothetical protein
MKTMFLIQAVGLVMGAVCALAQELPSPSVSSPSIADTGVVPKAVGVASGGDSNAVLAAQNALLLSNRAVLVLSKWRGTEPGAVKLKFGDPAAGRFEIDLSGVTDVKTEAEMLSKDFGPRVAVIVDEATPDGKFRTNHVFRNGESRLTIAPVPGNILPPGGKRMYVWPEGTRPAAPTKLRVRDTQTN